MVSNRTKIVALGAMSVCVVGAFALTKPGTARLKHLFSASTPAATAQAPLDLEQRVRERHGWSSILNSVITGRITYYSREGQARDQADFTVSRIYPDRMRVALNRGGSNEVMGFDQDRTWKQASASLTETQARDVRAWLRFWPERLFSSRSRGQGYREAGRRVETSRAATPWQAATELGQPSVLEQIEVVDVVGSVPTSQRTGDRRTLYYYIDRDSLLLRSARWLEPDDPLRADNPRSPRMDSRVDFGNWQERGGVMWPMEITRWLGGNVQFRIEVSDVRVNQPLGDELFQRP